MPAVYETYYAVYSVTVSTGRHPRPQPPIDNMNLSEDEVYAFSNSLIGDIIPPTNVDGTPGIILYGVRLQKLLYEKEDLRKKCQLLTAAEVQEKYPTITTKLIRNANAALSLNVINRVTVQTKVISPAEIYGPWGEYHTTKVTFSSQTKIELIVKYLYTNDILIGSEGKKYRVILGTVKANHSRKSITQL